MYYKQAAQRFLIIRKANKLGIHSNDVSGTWWNPGNNKIWMRETFSFRVGENAKKNSLKFFKRFLINGQTFLFRLITMSLIDFQFSDLEIRKLFSIYKKRTITYLFQKIIIYELVATTTFDCLKNLLTFDNIAVSKPILVVKNMMYYNL